MNRIILADDQLLFRAGVARVLAMEEDMRIVAQCEDAARLQSAIPSYRAAVVLFSISVAPQIGALLAAVREAGSRAILVQEKGEQVAEEHLTLIFGSVQRTVSAAALLDCIRRVARGQRCVQGSSVAVLPAQDAVGARVRDRLTPRELQIVALITQGCKNKEIATQLGTKEQVVKNYLRSIYDKSGVSDRLELALFTLHHRTLLEAATRAGQLVTQRKTA